MADEKEETQREVDTKFLEALYGDPFREETNRTGRHLIVASSLCVAAVVFGVSFKSSSLIPIDFAEHNEVLPMLLALVVLLMFASFLLRAITDLLRDREVSLLVTRYISDAQLKVAESSARSVDEDISSQTHEEEFGPSEPDPWWEPYYEVKQKVQDALEKAEQKIGIRRAPVWVRRVRKFAEMAVPCFFAALALYVSRSALWKLGIGVLGAL